MPDGPSYSDFVMSSDSFSNMALLGMFETFLMVLEMCLEPATSLLWVLMIVW